MVEEAFISFTIFCSTWTFLSFAFTWVMIKTEKPIAKGYKILISKSFQKRKFEKQPKYFIHVI